MEATKYKLTLHLTKLTGCGRSPPLTARACTENTPRQLQNTGRICGLSCVCLEFVVQLNGSVDSAPLLCSRTSPCARTAPRALKSPDDSLYRHLSSPLIKLNASVGKEQISIEECCSDGHQRGSDNQDCTALPLISESTTCRSPHSTVVHSSVYYLSNAAGYGCRQRAATPFVLLV
ncbi:unnamed protein product [Boreogadus saida]